MREVDIDGTKLHFARNEKEWREEIEKRYYYDTKYHTIHHIIEVGNTPLLRLCVENGVKIPMGLHIKQKSTSLDERITFQKIIRDMTDKDVWRVLHQIKAVSMVDPRCTKLVGEQLK